MAVPRVAGTKRTSIGNQLDTVLGHHNQAAVHESCGGCRRPLETRDLLWRAKPPRCLLPEMARIANPSVAIEQYSSSSQRRQSELVPCSGGIKKAPAIVIAEEGKDTGRTK